MIPLIAIGGLPHNIDNKTGGVIMKNPIKIKLNILGGKNANIE
jgi:hypothetical protein